MLFQSVNAISTTSVLMARHAVQGSSALLRPSRFIYREALPVLYANTTFTVSLHYEEYSPGYTPRPSNLTHLVPTPLRNVDISSSEETDPDKASATLQWLEQCSNVTQLATNFAHLDPETQERDDKIQEMLEGFTTVQCRQGVELTLATRPGAPYEGPCFHALQKLLNA
jgi:hypothetical protein